LYEFLKSCGSVVPAPKTQSKTDYHPDFTFSAKGAEFTIEARTFLIQGNDSKIENISHVIINILSAYESAYLISFEVFDYTHETIYADIEPATLDYEIRLFLDNWLFNSSSHSNREVILSNGIKIRFGKQEKGYNTSSRIGEIVFQAPLHNNRF
jgi:hypothetical protein